MLVGDCCDGCMEKGLLTIVAGLVVDTHSLVFVASLAVVVVVVVETNY
jgi:hypothetical protein